MQDDEEELAKHQIDWDDPFFKNAGLDMPKKSKNDKKGDKKGKKSKTEVNTALYFVCYRRFVWLTLADV